MKKNYILLIALLTIFVSYGQSIRTFDGSTDATWSDATNWDADAKPTTSAPWDEVITAMDSDVDEAVTITKYTVTGSTNAELSSSGVGSLVIDGYTDGNTTGISNELTAGIFTINANIEINNSQITNTNRYTTIESVNATKMVFGSSSVLTPTTRFTIESAGDVEFNGLVSGTSVSRLRLDGGGTFTFLNAFSDMSVRHVYVYDGAVVNFNAATGTEAVSKIFHLWDGTSSIDKSTYTINLNAVDCFKISNLNFNEFSTTTYNVNEDNEEMGAIRLQQEAIVDVTIAATKKISFLESNTRGWDDTSVFNITGYDFSPASGDPSNIRFGTSSSGLTSEQIDNIVLVGGDDAGKEVTIDENGYIILFDAATALFKEFDNGVNSGGSEDNTWSDQDNWTEGVLPVDGDYITMIEDSEMDIDGLTLRSLTASGSGDLTFDKSGSIVLTIDTELDDRYTAISNSLDAGGTFTFDGLATIMNGAFENTVDIYNSEATNTLTFGNSSVVTLNTNVTIQNAGDVIINGVFKEGASTRTFRLSGNGDYTFNSDLALTDVSLLIINNHPNSGGTIDLNFANSVGDDKRININGSTTNTNIYAINLNATNTLVTTEIDVEEKVQLTLNINESQDNLGALIFEAESELNIDIVTGKSCVFSDSSAESWDATATIAITGFVQDEGVTPNTSNVRFGTDENGLSVTQLSQVTVNGEAASISSAGYIVRANSLSVTNENAIDFAIYPNPVVDVLTITSEENIAKYEVLNLVGTTVVSVSSIENGLNVSNLTSGVYILRLTSANGISTAKFVKK